MANVLIHRCTLRLVRRGGWNWGPDPRGMAQNAVHTLPELLARKLSKLLPDEQEVEIATPIRICFSIRISELSEELPLEPSADDSPDWTPPSLIDQRMELALRTAFGVDQTSPLDIPASQSEDAAIERFEAEYSGDPLPEGSALSRLLLAWHEHGVLERRVAAMPLEQVEAWHRRLQHAPTAMSSNISDPASAQRIEAFVHSRWALLTSQDAVEDHRRRILIATSVAANLRVPLEDRELWRVLNQLVAAESYRVLQPTAASPSGGVHPDGETPLQESDAFVEKPYSAASHSPPPVIVVDRPPIGWEVKIDCALPFLLLGPLAKLGYFETLAAVLEAANLSQEAHLFAAALSYKVLDPPQRGWRRSPASMLAAATLAGLVQAVSEESLINFARRIAHHTSVLDLTLADALIAGHTPGDPVTLQSDGSTGFLLLDTHGCFPIAMTGEVGSLLAMLKRLGSSVVLISGDVAGTCLLSELDSNGIVFVIDVPPARGEQWSQIQQGPDRLGWTNCTGTATEEVRRAACEKEPAWEEARALLRELGTARPGVVRAASPELDRSLTLAAAVALGMTAWKLWQARGRTSSQQLLERYADLEGRIRFDSSSVKVALPLGRRHRELRENGLLAPVDGIPWLGGRRIEFGGG